MKRYTIDMGEKFDVLLSDLAVAKETTKSEIIRRALAAYAYLTEQIDEGKKISVTDKQDRVLKDVVLP